MTAFFSFLHVVAAIFLVVVILMQAGRGGGLTEGFAAAETMFGSRTNEFMVRTTTILASVFLATSLLLAHLSAKQEESLLKEMKAPATAEQPSAASNQPSAPAPVPAPDAAAQ